MSIADKNKDRTTVGLVMIPRRHGAKATEQEPWIGYEVYGHTAILIRVAGKITRLAGWMPEGAFDPSKPPVPGKWNNDLAMLQSKVAESYEYEATDDYCTRLSTHLDSDSAKKWKYHFSGKADYKDSVFRNCVKAALNVLIFDGPLETVKAQAEAIKKAIKDEMVRNELSTSEYGYLQELAIKAAKATKTVS